MVLADEISPGDRVTVDEVEGELRFDVERGAGVVPGEEPAEAPAR